MSTPSPYPTQTGDDNICSGALTLGGTTLRSLVTSAARHQSEQSLDLSGIFWMEHVNLVVGNKELAEYFYLNVLGCTRDAGKSFHVNMGQQQFHLAENGEPAQRFAGSIGVVVPDLEALRTRIAAAQASQKLRDTQFALLRDENRCVTVRGPWGNLFHLYGAQEDDALIEPSLQKEETTMKMVNMHSEGGIYGAHRMGVRGGQPGIRFVEVACPMGKSRAIAQFYRQFLNCQVWETFSTSLEAENVPCALVEVGPGVHLTFVEHETIPEEATKAQEGIHICIYVHDFKGIYSHLSLQGLIWTNPRFVHLDRCDSWEEAKESRTLRFKNIIDVETGETILQLEHETRPLRHGQYLKVPLYEPK